MPKLLVGVLILIVVVVAVNAVLTQAPKPQLKVVAGGRTA